MNSSTKHWYNKLPLIGYQMKPYTKPDGVYLPNRGKGNFDAKIYSGRGIKFNGVDQAVVTDIYPKVEWSKQTISCEIKEALEGRYEIIAGCAYSPSAPVGSLCITEFSLNDGTYDTYSINIHYEYNGVDYGIALALASGFQGTVTGSLDFTTGEMKGYIDGKLIKSQIFEDLVGKTTYSFSYPFAVGAGTTASEAARGYLNKSVSNMLFLTDILSDSEVQYLHTNPERFLYREDSVLKSKILPQNKIDAIEFYAPMCETDSYIRDYSKYSEINVAGTVATGEGTGDEVSTLTKVSDTAFDLVITTAGTSTSSPYVENSFITSASSNYYKVSFNVTVNSGVCVLHSLYNGSSLVVNKTLENEHYEVVLNKGDDTYQYTTLYFDGSQLFDISITDFKVEVLDGIYPIVNYTTDQNVLKLSTGLQTCFWERDILGVPNRLVEKGIIGDPLKGSASTSSYALNLTEDFTIEAVWYCPTTEHNYQIFGNSWDTGLLIGNHKNIGYLYFRLFSVEYYPQGYEGQFVHIVITFSAATKTVSFYVNGVLGYSADSTITEATTTPIELRNYGLSYTADNDLRLFNIHTTPQDPLELYNNAVRKGLLS